VSDKNAIKQEEKRGGQRNIMRREAYQEGGKN
jgi:hypothetical protein